MTYVISGKPLKHIGGHGLPEAISPELKSIIEAKWGGSLPQLADYVFPSKKKESGGYYTVYSILVQGGGKASLELIDKIAKGIGCSKSEVAFALKQKTEQARKKALLSLCKTANISITELSTRCFGHKANIYGVLKSNKRTQNFLKLVDALNLDVESFEEHYKKSQFAS